MKGRIVIDPPKSLPPPPSAAQSVSAASAFPAASPLLSPWRHLRLRRAVPPSPASLPPAALLSPASLHPAALLSPKSRPRPLPLYRLCLRRREARTASNVSRRTGKSTSFHGPLLHSSALVRIIRTETEKLMMSVACPCDSFVCTSLKFESFALINSPPVIFLWLHMHPLVSFVCVVIGFIAHWPDQKRDPELNVMCVLFRLIAFGLACFIEFSVMPS